MKEKNRGRGHLRSYLAAGGWRRPLAVLLAATFMALSAPMGGCLVSAAEQIGDAESESGTQADGGAGMQESGSEAGAQDQTTCSLSVKAGSSEIAEDLATADVQVDLYRIADASRSLQYDAFDWTMTAPFSALQIAGDIDTDGWKALARQAAGIVLGDGPAAGADGHAQAGAAEAVEGGTAAGSDGSAAGSGSGAAGGSALGAESGTAGSGTVYWDPSASAQEALSPDGSLLKTMAVSPGSLTADFAGLPAGLYLIIAHGRGIAEYAAAAPSENGSALFTVAHSRTIEYRFSPEIVALPTKAADPETGAVNTANAGPWLYDVSLTLKPSSDPREGALRITKVLDNYELRKKTSDGQTREIRDAAAFVFEVTAYESAEAYAAQGGSAPRLYHNYASITFNGAGTRSAVLDGLPADAYVVVREVYSGRTYTADADQTAVIDPAGTAEVTFENRYDDMHGGAGSVTNHFTYKADEGKWGWEQREDSSEDAAVLQAQ